MTRSERIHKLAHAIKCWRGAYVPNSNPRRWIRRPDPSALPRVKTWLARLDVSDVPDAVFIIENFASYEEMNRWLAGLEQPRAPRATDPESLANHQVTAPIQPLSRPAPDTPL